MPFRKNTNTVVRLVSILFVFGFTVVSSFIPHHNIVKSGRCSIRYSNGKQLDDISIDLKDTSTNEPHVLLTQFSSSASTSSPSFSSRRRDTLVSLASLLLGSSIPTAALAFDNKISNQYDDRPKRRGPQPKDLGVATRISLEGDEYLGLKPCGVAPNCFCSTMSVEEDSDHSIPAWTWPATKTLSTKIAAFEQLYQVLQSYPPGQNGVDGGGFQFQKYDPNVGYIYVIYEALKNGYHDDVEFAYIDNRLKNEKGNNEQQQGNDNNDNDSDSNRQIQIRSSSRVGYLDLGVNAKRLNWIAKELRLKGWDAPGVDFTTHRGYALENQI